jgi:hypothetical protein
MKKQINGRLLFEAHSEERHDGATRTIIKEAGKIKRLPWHLNAPRRREEVARRQP